MQKPKKVTDGRVRLESRPNDFSRRRGAILLQAGCCCCCCCCCLHWLGAAVGGGMGVARAWKPAERWSHVHDAAKRYVFWGTIAGVFASIGLILLLGILAAARIIQFEAVWVPIAFVPSLTFIPMGVCAIVAGLLAVANAPSASEEPQEQRNAFDLGCRVAWMSFWYASLGMVIGYLLMLPFLFAM